VGPLAVTWSLAVEEQFYLVWPFVVRFSSRAQIGRIAAAVFCAGPFIRWVLLARGVNIYSNVFCRLDGIMWGALLAVAVRSRAFEGGRRVGAAWMALAVSLPLALLAATLHLDAIVYSLSAFASIALVYVALFAPEGWLQWLLTNRFIVYTGTISYGLYLLHKLPFDAVKSLPLDRYAPLALLGMLAACYLIAAISWVAFEKPLLGLKRLFESGRKETQSPWQPLPSNRRPGLPSPSSPW
jgi:peptidoglycan/LPS O-acetylase OafA/YrhL